jgi:hypothetical protein
MVASVGADRDRHADDGREQRQAGGQERAQRDRQHEEADHDARSLGAGLGLVGHEAAAELHLQAGGAGGIGARLQLVARRIVDLVGRLGIDHVRVTDATGVPEGARPVRVDDEGDPVRAPRSCHRPHHGGAVLGVGEPLAGACGEDHARRRPARARILLVQQILRALGLGARHLEPARELALEGGNAGDDEAEHNHPADQHAAAVAERPTAKPIEIPSHCLPSSVGDAVP